MSWIVLGVVGWVSVAEGVNVNVQEYVEEVLH